MPFHVRLIPLHCNQSRPSVGSSQPSWKSVSAFPGRIVANHQSINQSINPCIQINPISRRHCFVIKSPQHPPARQENMFYFFPLFLMPCWPAFSGPLPLALSAISLRAFSSTETWPNGGCQFSGSRSTREREKGLMYRLASWP